MTPVVAVIAPGMMGAPVGKRLVEHGLKVLRKAQANGKTPQEWTDQLVETEWRPVLAEAGQAARVTLLHRRDAFKAPAPLLAKLQADLPRVYPTPLVCGQVLTILNGDNG